MGLPGSSEILFHKSLRAVVLQECSTPYHISAGGGSDPKLSVTAQHGPWSHPSRSLPRPRQSGSQRLPDRTLPNAEIAGKGIKRK